MHLIFDFYSWLNRKATANIVKKILNTAQSAAFLKDIGTRLKFMKPKNSGTYQYLVCQDYDCYIQFRLPDLQ